MAQLLPNPFYTDSAHKAYEKALSDVMAYLTEHNRRCEVREFALAYPLFLDEDDYWALQRRVKEATNGRDK